MSLSRWHHKILHLAFSKIAKLNSNNSIHQLLISDGSITLGGKRRSLRNAIKEFAFQAIKLKLSLLDDHIDFTPKLA